MPSAMTRHFKAAAVSAACFSAFAIAGFAAVPAATERVYFFLSRTQSPDGSVGGEIRRAADQALVASVFLYRGHINRARRALDILDNIREADKKSGGFKGFAQTYDDKSRVVSGRIDPFAQAAAASAFYNYKSIAGTSRYDRSMSALADLYLARVNPWGVVSDFSALSSTSALPATISSPSAVENLCAYYIFNAAAAYTRDDRYLKAAKRLGYALKDLFFEETRKSFVADLSGGPAAPDSYANMLGALFGGPWRPAVSLDAGGGLGRMSLSELAAAQYTASANSSVPSPEPATAMFLSFPPEIPDGAFIGASDGQSRPKPDYFATAVFVFLAEKNNPFAIRDENFLRRVDGAEVPRGEQWKSDGFESGEREFYSAPREAVRNADVFLSPDNQSKKNGSFSLRAQYLPLKNEKSSAIVTRVFYPAQDFSGAGRLRFWLAARPAVFTLGAMNLKIRLRVIDESGVWADSQPLNYSGRGVENSVVCPAGFTPSAVGKHPDYSKIKKLVWMFEEETQTSWNINLDDVRIE
jgi:hypothetical protein